MSSQQEFDKHKSKMNLPADSPEELVRNRFQGVAQLINPHLRPGGNPLEFVKKTMTIEQMAKPSACHHARILAAKLKQGPDDFFVKEVHELLADQSNLEFTFERATLCVDYPKK